MRHIFADIEILNGGDLYKSKLNEIGLEEVRSYKLNILVDKGALMLNINQTIK